MSKKRKNKTSHEAEPSGPAPPLSRDKGNKRLPAIRFLALIAAILAVGLGLYTAATQDVPAVPAPDRSDMEPQVAAKVEEHRKAVLDAPESHEAWGRLGMVFQAHGKSNEASECYREAIALEPREFRWHYLLAHTLMDTDNERALAHAGQASALKPDYAPAYVLQGQILEEENQPERALEHYAKATEVDSRCAPAELGLARLYLAKGELEKSLRHAERARQLSEDAAPVHALLARVYLRTGDREAAMEANRLASTLKGKITLDDPVHFQMSEESVSSLAQLRRAMDAENSGDLGKAEALYRELLEIRPDDANIREKLGTALARQDKLQPAKEQYLRALEINPELAPARYGLGNLLNFEGKFDEAAEQYGKALEHRPDHVPTLVNLGSIRAFQGDLEQAAALFRKALEIDSRSFAAHRQLGQVLLQQGKVKEALSHFQTALEARRDYAPLHVQLALAYASIGSYREAWTHVNKAQELGGQVPPKLLEELQKRYPQSLSGHVSRASRSVAPSF